MILGLLLRSLQKPSQETELIKYPERNNLREQTYESDLSRRQITFSTYPLPPMLDSGRHSHGFSNKFQ